MLRGTKPTGKEGSTTDGAEGSAPPPPHLQPSPGTACPAAAAPAPRHLSAVQQECAGAAPVAVTGVGGAPVQLLRGKDTRQHHNPAVLHPVTHSRTPLLLDVSNEELKTCKSPTALLHTYFTKTRLESPSTALSNC